ncbi:50S ribosomal protein L20 [Candidatus Peregrinibacteria bacterium]|nr:50S ribosomal protein L20 [Candidatus Peregrinibacteria bacterium]MBI4129127.1 50S ribosomal protein L20 [Candidatus Peregrinibacteria bacterium]
MRVKRGTVRHRRHKKIRALARGYMDLRHATFAKANEAVLKAGQHAFRDRRKKKRVFRALWTVRLNAAARSERVSYSVLIRLLKRSNVQLDRKVLSELAISHPQVFHRILQEVQGNAQKPGPS